jgi:serine/threonine protein phosphatase PrpC
MDDSTGMRLRVGAATHIGRVRTLNEDAFIARVSDGLFIVCDGMGGAPAGEVASQMAVDAILAQLDRREKEPAAVRGARNQSGYLAQTHSLVEAVRRSNQFVYSQAQQDPNRAEMGTTVVSARIKHHVASVAHVGDSRAYHWHSDRLEPLTRDHSLVEAQVRAGLVDRDASVHCSHRNILVRVLGREPDVDVDANEVPLQQGDYLLLCSDGLTSMVPDNVFGKAIAELRHPQRICDYLIDTANAHGGEDNITVVVVEVMGSWWRRLSDRWRRQLNGQHDA